MKLLFENWRRYLKEEQETPITKLRVFDFDDTLIHTLSKAIVRDKKGKKIRTLDSQEEFEAYEKTKGKEFPLDFSEFDKVPKKTPPIKKIIEIFRNLVEHPGKDRKIMIITARKPEAAPEIRDYLENLKPPIDISDVEIVGTGGGSKAPRIQEELEALPNVNNFIMYDDSEKNLGEVDKMMKKAFRNIKVKLRRPMVQGGKLVSIPTFKVENLMNRQVYPIR